MDILIIHYDELINYIHARFGNRPFAIEVVQETCVRLLSKSDEFDQMPSSLALLKRISLHLAIDLYRHNKMVQRYIDYSLDDDDFIQITEMDDLTLPELAVAKAQYEKLLIQAVQSLPMICQDVFILTQLYHLTQVETAQQMGISRTTVIKHLTLAFEALAPILFEKN